MIVAPPWPLSPAALVKLERGGYQVHDFSAGAARGAIVRFFVKAPLHRCYAVLADVKAMPSYMPGLASIKVLSASDDTKILAYHSSIPLIPDFVLARHFEPDRRITWSKVRAPYKTIDGAWNFQSVQGGTVLSYWVAIDTGQVLVPSWLALDFEKQGSSRLVHAVRRRIEVR